MTKSSKSRTKTKAQASKRASAGFPKMNILKGKAGGMWHKMTGKRGASKK